MIISEIAKLTNTILDMFNSFVKSRKFKKDLITKIIMHRLSLKYLPSDYDACEIMQQERLFGDYIRIYLGKDFYNAYVSNSKNIFWNARYKADFSDAVIEESLEAFVRVAKSKKILRKDF